MYIYIITYTSYNCTRQHATGSNNLCLLPTTIYNNNYVYNYVCKISIPA